MEGPSNGYFAEVLKSTLVLKEEYMEKAREIFADLGVDIMLESRSFGGCIGNKKGIEEYVMEKGIGTFCKPKFGNFDGNGPRPGERCETKWRIFAKIHPNVRLEGPGTEQNFRFGSAWPVRVCPCGHVLRQFGIAGRRINFCSFCLFFSYVIIFEIVELYSVNFVFSSCSMFSSSEVQAITKPSISPSEGVVTREKA